MNLYYRILLKFVLTVIGIVLIANVPALFQGMKLDVVSYISAIQSFVINIIHPGALTYGQDQRYDLFPGIWGKWEYSMILLFIAFFVSFLMALALTYMTMLLTRKYREKIKFLLFLTESIPDVLVIGFFTILLLSIYKHTSHLFFDIVAYGDERIFVLPLIVLVILPTLLFYRTMIYDFEEEASQLYIEHAKSKGLTKHKILFSHIFRNAYGTASDDSIHTRDCSGVGFAHSSWRLSCVIWGNIRESI